MVVGSTLLSWQAYRLLIPPVATAAHRLQRLRAQGCSIIPLAVCSACVSGAHPLLHCLRATSCNLVAICLWPALACPDLPRALPSSLPGALPYPCPTRALPFPLSCPLPCLSCPPGPCAAVHLWRMLRPVMALVAAASVTMTSVAVAAMTELTWPASSLKLQQTRRRHLVSLTGAWVGSTCRVPGTGWSVNQSNESCVLIN